MTSQTALRLGRVSNLPTVWTNVMAAAALTEMAVPILGVVATAIACSCFYVGGMFLNDAFDRQFDARVRPERPIPSGAAGVGEVFGVGFGLLGAGLAVVGVTARLAIGTATSGLAAGLALAAAIVLYDVWHKDNPAAPMLMGLCRVLVYVTTAAVLTNGFPGAVGGAAGALWFYLIGLTYVARRENFGSVGNVWPLACLGIPFVVWTVALHAGGVAAWVYVGTLGWVLACVSHLGWRARVDVPRAVVGMIAGIALVDAMAIATFGSSSLALVAVGCFGLTVVLQRWVPGT